MADTPQSDRRDNSIRKILDAALNVFATLGFNGATLDDIAREAGMNKAMLYYRIGDKRTLYQAVIHDIYKDRTQGLTESVLSKQKPEEKLNAFIAHIAATLSDHPNFTRIMMREVITGWTNFSDAVLEDVTRTLKIVRDIIEDGVKKGVFAKADPLAVHNMVLGSLLLHTLSLPVKDQIKSILKDTESAAFSHSFDTQVPEVQKMILAALQP